MQETWRKVLSSTTPSKAHGANNAKDSEQYRYLWDRPGLPGYLAYVLVTICLLFVGYITTVIYTHWPSHNKAEKMQTARIKGFEQVSNRFFPSVENNQLIMPVWNDKEDIIKDLSAVKLPSNIETVKMVPKDETKEQLATNKLYLKLHTLPAGTLLLELCGRNHRNLSSDNVHCEFHGRGEDNQFWSHAEEANTIQAARSNSQIPFKDTTPVKKKPTMVQGAVNNQSNNYLTVQKASWPKWLTTLHSKGNWDKDQIFYTSETSSWVLLEKEGIKKMTRLDSTFFVISKDHVITSFNSPQSLKEQDRPPILNNIAIYGQIPEVL